jgi:hypothetical protein
VPHCFLTLVPLLVAGELDALQMEQGQGAAL